MRPCQSRHSRRLSIVSKLALAGALLVPFGASFATAQMLQLDPLKPEYTLGGFRYQAPKVDGWRQIANSTQSLQLVYAEQHPDEKIDTKFAVIMEAADIPPGTEVPNAAWLAELSRKQQADKPERKELLKGLSPILLVPGVDNLFTYRFLVKAPDGAVEPEAYEVFYVMVAPDLSQYLVIQAITKEKSYENQLYFQQFYASLNSLKHPGSPGGGEKAADAATVDKPASGSDAAPAAKPADKPADAPKVPETPGHEGHGH